MLPKKIPICRVSKSIYKPIFKINEKKRKMLLKMKIIKTFINEKCINY